MTDKKKEKTLWEYILLAVSVFATLVQVLGLVSTSQALFSHPVTTLVFVFLVLIGTTASCVFVLLRKKAGTFTAKVNYYTKFQRNIALGVLITNVIIFVSTLGVQIYRPCLSNIEQIADGEFGIIVADFTEGTSRFTSPQGKELAERTYNALQNRLNLSTIAEKVTIRRSCAIRNQDEAIRVGQESKASLVIWGNVVEFADDTFDPSFTFTTSSQIDSNLFEVELNKIDFAEMPSSLSARTVSIASFTIGLAYITNAETSEDYLPAIREFTLAINTTKPELSKATVNSEQELALKRTLAIFYVMRGRSYAALGDTESAINDFLLAVETDENLHSSYVALGNHYYAIKDYEQAEKMYKKAISLSETPSAYFGLGNVFFYTNKIQDCINAYTKSIDLVIKSGNDPSGVRLILATVYILNGQKQEAISQLNEILQSEKSSDYYQEQAREKILEIQDPSAIAAVTAPTPFPTPTVMAGAIYVDASDGMIMVYIPGGEFSMGASNSDKNANDNEKPQHIVSLDSFWIDKYEVTNAMYSQCVFAGICTPPTMNKSNTHDNYFGATAYMDYPVINVSWHDANNYCQWAGRRLPTEAEWEKAARGTDSRIYPWGNTEPDSNMANFGMSNNDTQQVGSYPDGVSPYGTLDMAGNIREWIADWYLINYFEISPSNNPLGPDNGVERVIRGGSFLSSNIFLRATNRDFAKPENSFSDVGFRCAQITIDK